MGKAFLKKTTSLLQAKRKRKRWQRTMISLSLVVAMVTSCLLIHPAITMERIAICGQEEHTHTKECYEHRLVCGKTEQSAVPATEEKVLNCPKAVHEHGEGCYDAEGQLVCTAEAHNHDDSCYQIIRTEGVEGHTHTDACYEDALICGKQEHTHTEACYPKETEAATQAQTKTVTEAAKTETATEKAETEKATEAEKPEARTLTVKNEEYTIQVDCPADAKIPKNAVLSIREIKKNDRDYNSTYEKAASVVLMKTAKKIETVRFFDLSISADGKEIQPEAAINVKITFTKPIQSPEGSEVRAVRLGDDADVLATNTNKANGSWNQITFKAKKLTVYATAEIAVPVAETAVTETETSEVMMLEAEAEETETEAATEAVTEEVTEAATEEATEAVTEEVTEAATEEATEAVMEEVTEAVTEESTEEPDTEEMTEEDPATPHILTTEGSDYTVEVTYTAEAGIPEGAELQVREIAQGTAEYESYYQQAMAAVQEGDTTSISFARFFDISFVYEGEEIEPSAPVAVKITYADAVEVPEAGEVKSVHFGDEAEVLNVQTNEKNGAMDEVTFDAESFSVYGIVGTIDTSIMLRKIFEDENYIITAGYTAKAEIPDDAKFIAEEITKEDDAEHFAEREAQSCEILNDKDVVVKALLNIGFYQNDVEIEPADTVQLTIQFKNENEYQEGQEFSVVHFTGEVPEVVAEGTLDENSSISCSVESFSEFTITGSDGTEYTIKEIENPTALNATVKLFNYTGEINSKKLGEKGYKFHNSNSPTVDGNDSTGSNNKPTMKNQLGSDKYPAAIINNQEISFDDLFNDTQVEGKTVAGTMKDGGGLFQKDKNGYYEYDSAKNAAYYDGERRKFVLYDGVIRPSYNNNLNDNSAGDIERGNFLPFNVLSSSSVSNKDVVKQSDGITNAYKLAGGKDASEGCTDLWFGMTVEFNFYMPKDGKINGNEMIFDFKGDDDVFVYIDDNLVLDIGGTHAAQSGSINFATGEVTDPSTSTAATLKEIFELKEKTFNDYSQHTLKFFYLERGGNISYCRLRFNMPTIPENSLTVAKNLVTDGTDNNSEITDYLKKTLTYKFRVLKADDDGNPSTELFIREGTSYTTSYGNEGIVGENGIFELKDGESATFENMASIGEFDQYVVEELLPDSTQGQYSGVEYNLGETTGNIKTDENAPEGFTGHYTDRLRVDATNVVGYSNKVDTSKLCSLNIKKEVAEGSMFPDDKTFRIQVMLGGEPLPANTQYTVGSDTKTVTEAGIIELKDGETAKILGILSGTTFEIEEVKENNYRTSYTGTISYDDNKTDINVTADGKVTGDFPLKSTVDIVVHNSDHDFTVDIPIYKQYVDNVDGNTETFTFKLTRVDENGTEDSSTSFSKKTTLTVTGDQEIDGKFIIGYENGEEGKYYYKITEIPGANKAIQYDSSYYIVGVSVSGNTANIISIKKNGQDLGESGKVAFVNKSGMNVVLKKVDTADSTKVLANARFDLYGSDYHNTDGSVNPEAKIMKQITTSTEGTAELGFLKPGTYYLVETQAPDGYNKLTEPVTFNITRDGLKVMQGSNSSEVTEPDSTGNYMLVVTNSTGIELPHTGGIGTFIYTLSGLLLMAIALMYGFVSRRRREGRLK